MATISKTVSPHTGTEQFQQRFQLSLSIKPSMVICAQPSVIEHLILTAFHGCVNKNIDQSDQKLWPELFSELSYCNYFKKPFYKGGNEKLNKSLDESVGQGK